MSLPNSAGVYQTPEWVAGKIAIHSAMYPDLVPIDTCVAGILGHWTPVQNDAVIPADIAAMAAITADPETDWTAGQKSPPLGDASVAHYDTAAWAAGAAT